MIILFRHEMIVVQFYSTQKRDYCFPLCQVRWFYKREQDRDWLPFMGYDSLRLELRYRHIWQTKWGTGAANQVKNL